VVRSTTFSETLCHDTADVLSQARRQAAAIIALPVYPVVLDAAETNQLVYKPSLSTILQEFNSKSPLLLRKSKTVIPNDYSLRFVAPIVACWCLLENNTRLSLSPATSFCMWR
jgi:hypothetical protein